MRNRVAGMLAYLTLVLFFLLVAWIARSLCDDKGGWWSSCRPMPWDQRDVPHGQPL